MPGSDGSVVNNELVLLFVLRPGADLESPLDEGISVLDLFEIGLALFLLLANLSLLFTFSNKNHLLRSWRMQEALGRRTGPLA